MDYRKELTKALENIYTNYFDNEIKPVLDRYNWILYWANGSIGVDDQQGNSKIDTKTINILIGKANKTFEGYYLEEYTSLWEIMTTINKDNDQYGVYKLPCYNPEKN